MHPIWKPKVVTLGTAADYEFYITKGGAEIYRGHAYKRPGGTSVTVRINDICAQYLATMPLDGIGYDDFDDYSVYDLPAVAEFKTYLADGTLKDTTTFVMDWSYDKDRAEVLIAGTGSEVNLLAPIVPVWPDHLPIYYSVPTGRGILFSVEGGGTTFDFSYPSVVRFGAALFEGTDEFAIEDHAMSAEIIFPLRHYCHATCYALYYVNAYGGWDVLVCSGKALHTRTFDRREVSRSSSYGNFIEPGNRGRDNYATAVQESWQLSTPFLTDDQAARMHHLLGSREVWLVTPEGVRADEIIHLPVVITNADCPDKTWRNQDGGMVSYTLNVELAEERRR